METREKNLIKNTLIFGLGNFGSKILQIVLIPFYTRILTSSEYGVVDILQALVSLLLPIFSLAIYEGVFRFAMDKNYDKNAVITAGLFVNIVGNIIMFLLGLVLMRFFDAVYVWLVITNTAVVALWTLLSQYTKAIGKSILYSVNNVVLTAVVLVLNIVFLAVLRLGIVGYMCGYILANMIAVLMLLIALRSELHVNYKLIKKQLLIEMLIFSVPLVLNGICWWISSFTDRIMIYSMLGSAENGMYAAASKIPHLVSVMATIFCQAWQISANEEFSSNDNSKFYSKIYNELSGFVFLISSIIIVICRPLNKLFLGPDYNSAWIIVPALAMFSVFFSFSSFLLSIYSANKNTKMAFVTNLVCVLSNVVLNYIFIMMWGVIGAAIATATSYAILWLIRIADTKKVLTIEYDVKSIIISTLILIIQSVLICIERDIIITYSICVVGLIIIGFMYRRSIARDIQFGFDTLRKLIS